jgi:hypothetical protein
LSTINTTCKTCWQLICYAHEDQRKNQEANPAGTGERWRKSTCEISQEALEQMGKDGWTTAEKETMMSEKLKCPSCGSPNIARKGRVFTCRACDRSWVKEIKTGNDVAIAMSGLMSDLIAGRVTPKVGNATSNAAGKVLKAVENEYKYGGRGTSGKSAFLLGESSSITNPPKRAISLEDDDVATAHPQKGKKR